MILFIEIDLKEVSLLGKKFSWPKPKVCPLCLQSHLWGHGFSGTFFDGFFNVLYMKRYICPACGSVIKCRPKSHFPRIQSAIDTIKSCLTGRIEKGRWPCAGIGVRGRHWFSALKRQTLAHLGLEWQGQWIDAFNRLLGLGVVPVSESF